MATLDQFLALYTKKSLGVNELKTLWLDFLTKAAADAVAALYSTPGTFAPGVGLDVSAADQITLTPAAWKATNGLGKMLVGSATFNDALKFQNSGAVLYEVAATYGVVPAAVENAKDGSTHWGSWTEVIGFAGAPNAVSVSGGGLKFTVDSVCEAGVSCAGRKVWAYLTNPASPLYGTALELRTVAWDGTNNTITTVAQFGQTVGAPSLTAGDYTLVLQGPRIMRNTPMGALAGHVMLGLVLGGGSGNPPGGATTGSQVVYPDLMLFSQYCLELDAHGKPKVTVKADASDVATDWQLSVKNNAGTRKWWIDTAGNMHWDGEGDANGLVLGGSAPDNDLDALLPNNLLGAVNRSAGQERLLGAVWSPAVLSGCAVSAGAGLTINIASGVVMGGSVGGKRIENAAVNAMPVFGSSQQYLYWNGTSYDLSITAPTAAQSVIAQVITNAGAVLQVIDMRLFAKAVDQCLDIQVGGPNAHFSTLWAAVNYCNSLGSPESGSPSRKFRILVRGNTTEPAVIKFYTSGLTIEGVPGLAGTTGAAATVSWSGDRALFDLNAKLDLTFRNLSLCYDDAGALADPVVSRLAFDNSSASAAPTRLVIENVLVKSAQATRLHGYIGDLGGSGATWSDVQVRGCYLTGASEYGVLLPWAQDLRVVDCYIGSGGATQNVGPGTGSVAGVCVTGNRIWMRGLQLDGWGNRGIKVVSSVYVRVVDCTVANGNVNGTTTKYVGIEVDSSCLRVWLTNCCTHGGGAAAATAFGVQVAGQRVVIQGNDCQVNAAAAAKTGIDLTAASAYAMVDCNQTNTQGLAVAGGPHSVGASNRND